jgi:hypothetical protein
MYRILEEQRTVEEKERLCIIAAQQGQCSGNISKCKENHHQFWIMSSIDVCGAWERTDSFKYFLLNRKWRKENESSRNM